MGPTAFPAHGAVDQAVGSVPGGRIVYIDATGPFNREMVHQIRAAHTPTFRNASALGAFGHISTFHESMLATPEAFNAFAALLVEWKTMGILPTASAYVAGPGVEGRVFVEAHYRRAWEVSPFEIFDRRDDAEAWIARMLARPE